MKKAFVYSSKNNEILLESSSGGAFYELSKYYLTNLKGVVYGVAYKNGKFMHSKAKTFEELKSLMKSKYVRADLNNTFEDCMYELNEGHYVLYVGLPCEIFSLSTLLESKKIDTSRLLLVDLICHGSVDKKYWNSYIEEKFKNNVENVDFRYKKKNWEDFYIKIISGNSLYINSIKKDEFMRGFLNNYTLIESCYVCKFKGQNRKSDITLGDFWNCHKIDKNYFNKYGVSLILGNTEKGLSLLKLLNLSNREVDFDSSVLFNSSYALSVKKPSNHRNFVNLYNEKGFIYAVNKIIKKNKDNIFLRVFRKIKRVIKNG